MRASPGHDLGYVGLAGGLSLGARHEGVPDVPGLQVADMAGGALTAALRITAALLLRTRTGEGEWLDISMTEGVLPLMVPALAESAHLGPAGRPGTHLLTGGVPSYRLYRCRDARLIAVAAVEGHFQETIARETGVPEPFRDEDLAARFLEDDRDAWAERLGAACVTPVLEPVEVLLYPCTVIDPSVAAGRMPDRPPVGGPCPWLHAPAPALGEHTDAILREIGLRPEEG